MDASVSSPNPADRVLVLRLINPDSSCGFQFAACNPDITFVAWIDDGHGTLAFQVNDEDKYWLRADYLPLEVDVAVDLGDLRGKVRQALWADCHVGFTSEDDHDVNVATIACGRDNHYCDLEFRRDEDGTWSRVARDGTMMYGAAQVQREALDCARQAFLAMRRAAAASAESATSRTQ